MRSSVQLLLASSAACLPPYARALLPVAPLRRSSPAVAPTRFCRSPAACVPCDHEPEDNDGYESSPEEQLEQGAALFVDGSEWDADTAWLRFKLVMIEQLYGQLGPRAAARVGPKFRLPPPLLSSPSAERRTDLMLGAVVGTGVFIAMLHAYLATTGGIVILPEGGVGVTALNFEELRRLSSSDADVFLRLGIPMPAASSSPMEVGLLARLQLLFQ